MSASHHSIDCDGGTGGQVIADLRDNPFPDALYPTGVGGIIGMVGGLRLERWAPSRRNGGRLTLESATLDEGIPRICQIEKPPNEPRLQVICDGLFASHGEDLEREFPFMRWGGRGTKPDWSNHEARLWVELKYVREKKDILPITEAIAADITKYRSGGQRCLFVTYDPAGHMIERHAFIDDIQKHDGVMAHIIR